MMKMMFAAQEPTLMARAGTFGLNWTDVKDAVLAVGPDVLELVGRGMSEGWFTRARAMEIFGIVTRLVTRPSAANAARLAALALEIEEEASASSPTFAAVLPGVRGAVGGLIGNLIKDAILNGLKNFDWQAILQSIIQQILAGFTKPAAGSMQGPPAGVSP